MSEPTPEAITAVVERIKPLLAGEHPALQSAALADLLAIWLAGHVVPGNARATQRVRDKQLALHIDLVRELVPVNARMMGTHT